MGLFEFLAAIANTSSKNNKKKKREDINDWETHCESCGELLEDCECDWEDQSEQDISQDDMDDIDFDE